MLEALLFSAAIAVATAVSSSDPPIACRPQALDKAERERQRVLLETVRARREETRELPDGFAFRLRAEPGLFRDVAEWVSLERRCCPFLAFALEWTRDDALWVRLTGDPGVKAFLKQEMGAESSR